MRQQKIQQLGRVVRSEKVYSYVNGPKANLMYQAELIIERFLKSVGPNARGEFHIDVEFHPDAKTGSV
jgi:hypothetical protein